MTNSKEKNLHIKSVIALIIVTAIWGSGFVASDISLGYFDVFSVLTIRFLIGGALLLILSIKSIKSLDKQTLMMGISLGVLLFLAFYFQTIGLKHSTPSKNAFVTATNVVMVPFIGMFLLKSKVKTKNIIGAFMTIIGVSLLTIGDDFSFSIGDFYTLICAFLFALHITLTGEFSKKHNVLHLSCAQLIVSGVMGGVMMIFTESEIVINSSSLIAVGYLAIMPTAVAFLIQTWAQKRTTHTEAAIILSMEAVFGTVFSAIILHEVLTIKMIVGSFLILLSVLISELELNKIFRKVKS